jgi:PIN domain nuclease of toxin-antitoxin system
MLLLDTHVVLWWLEDDARLSRSARESIAAEARVSVSAVTVWEIAIKKALGKLMPPVNWPDEIIEFGFDPLPITFDHAVEAGALPRHHADPFDRMLVAQARIEGLTIVTADARVAQYDVPTMAP